jgi:hypothetical protein
MGYAGAAMRRISVALLCVLACSPKKGGAGPEPGTCKVEECGPTLGMPNSPCPDGTTIAGPSGRCLRGGDGSCGWEVIDCPVIATPPDEEQGPKTSELPSCTDAECGPQLGMPNQLCADGKTMSGPTGKCLRNEDGSCGWEVLGCPPT